MLRTYTAGYNNHADTTIFSTSNDQLPCLNTYPRFQGRRLPEIDFPSFVQTVIILYGIYRRVVVLPLKYNDETPQKKTSEIGKLATKRFQQIYSTQT